MADGPHEDSVCRQGHAVGHPAPARRPPQVVLHAVGAPERRSTPAAVRVPTALDDGGSPVRRQVLEHDAQPPVEVHPHPQVVRHLRMQPDAVAQAPESQVVRLRKAIGLERQQGSCGGTGRVSATALHGVMLARPRPLYGPRARHDVASRHQIVSAPRAAISGSGVAMRSVSIRPWAAIMRSNGSRCGPGIAPARNACLKAMASGR